MARWGSVLQDRWPVALVPRCEWRPYPRADDRGAWTALPDETKTALVAAGEVAAAAPWPALPARVWLDFARHGDRGSFEGPHLRRRVLLRDLALAECVEAEGRFCEDIADAVWAICEESWWGWTAHIGWAPDVPGLPDVSRPFIDLGVGESVALLAWVAYLLPAQLDGVSPLLRRRVEHEARQRVVDPFLERDDLWWHRGSNNWNPWCHSNIVTATLLLVDDEEVRGGVVAKALAGLDAFLDSYPPDGGCDEGPTYWTRAAGCLFDCLEVLHSATGGRLDVWEEPLVRSMAHYIVSMHVAGDWWVSFADGSARFRLPGPSTLRFGLAVGDDAVAALGADALRRGRASDPTLADSLTRMLPALHATPPVDDDAAPPLPADVWLPAIEVMAAREHEGSDRGLFVAAKGGHNDEAHNHNDVGTFIVACDGVPLIVDAGVGVYTAQTFGGGRYEIWTMQSGWHNVPVVNGVEQREGAAHRSGGAVHEAEAGCSSITLDLAGAYPAEAGLRSLRRTIALDRPDRQVVVTDAWSCTSEGAELALHLLTPAAVDVGEAAEGVLHLRGDRTLDVRFAATTFTATVDERELLEPNLAATWGPVLRRVRLCASGLPADGRATISIRATG